jgi:hypothetical protein
MIRIAVRILLTAAFVAGSLAGLASNADAGHLKGHAGAKAHAGLKAHSIKGKLHQHKLDKPAKKQPPPPPPKKHSLRKPTNPQICPECGD